MDQGLLRKMNQFDKIKQDWKNWPYKNSVFLLFSFILFYLIADTRFANEAINKVGSFGYFGALITGVFFVSIFTVAPAVAVLYHLAQILNPWGIAAMAGLGAMVGDYIIFKFIRNQIITELEPLFDKFGGALIKKLFFTPYFSWLLPILGAAIIASPIPDEVGVSMMGISKIKGWQFILITFTLNAIGIFLIVTLARSIS